MWLIVQWFATTFRARSFHFAGVASFSASHCTATHPLKHEGGNHSIISLPKWLDTVLGITTNIHKACMWKNCHMLNACQP